MHIKQRCCTALAGGLLLAWTGLASAQEVALDLSTPAQDYAQSAMPLLLAENDGVVTAKNNPAVTAPAAQEEFDAPWLTGNNAHLVMGLSTIALAVATAVTPPSENRVPRNRHGTHATLAKTTAGMAAGTVISGLLFHWDDLNVEDGWTDPDNLHFLLGTAGAALLGYAVAKSAASSDKTSHAALAEAGALGMALAVKINW